MVEGRSSATPKFSGLARLTLPIIYRAEARSCSGAVACAVPSAQLTLNFDDDSGRYSITRRCSFVASDDEESSEQLFHHH